ncbi:hypothetical protein SE954_30760, partial [Pseudomonas aeruginosa]|nr:hypothetical protein [Pseudomonas aeruginosa]
MLDPTLSDWLDRQADALDRGDADPGKELHRVGQPGGAGQAAGQQVAEQALAQFLVGTLQQVLDE